MKTLVDYEWEQHEKKQQHNMLLGYTLAALISTILWAVAICLFLQSRAEAAGYDSDQICDAIYLAEGGERAKKPFGILSVSCNGYDDCRTVCLNTVRNNRRRYAEYGYKQHDTYLKFLASRYAPVGASNDPRGLNSNWLKNVKWFLQNPK